MGRILATEFEVTTKLNSVSFDMEMEIDLHDMEVVHSTIFLMKILFTTRLEQTNAINLV